MKNNNLSCCPVCGEKLRVIRLGCPECGCELPADRPLNAYDYLTAEAAEFMRVFLRCRGNLKEVQSALNISYPTARKRLEDLLAELGFSDEVEEEKVMMNKLTLVNTDSVKASDIIRNKLYAAGGKAAIRLLGGKDCILKAGHDDNTFDCDKLPFEYEYAIFDVAVDFLLEMPAHRAPKGNGRNYKLGLGNCGYDTVVGALGKNFYHKNKGDSVYDPVFALAAVLDWAGIAHNGRGYLELTPDYLMKTARA